MYVAPSFYNGLYKTNWQQLWMYKCNICAQGHDAQ